MQRAAETHGHVDALETLRTRAHWSIQSSFLLALFAISAAMLALELLFLDVSVELRAGFVVLSLSWLMGSLYLFLFDLYFRGRQDQLVRKTKIVPGAAPVGGSARQPGLLRSKRIPLQGKPDYVVKTEGGYIPVAVKGGKSPHAPYLSHSLQLAAYCHLVADEYGVRPPHGVLSYPDRNFEVPFTTELEDEMFKHLLRIQLALSGVEVHRNHENPRRCLGCSRREGCPERLA